MIHLTTRNVILMGCCFVAGVLLASQTSNADPVTFSFTGTGTGAVGGNSFTNALFDISIMGDTNNSMPVPGFPNSTRVLSNSATVTINGTVSQIIPQLSVFSNTGGFVGLALPPSTDLILGPSDPAFAPWDLTTSIGPITGEASFSNWSSVTIGTSNGNLVFDDDDIETTFTAVVTPVPEPGFVSGLLLFAATGALRRRRS